jgi:ParB family chromosome partitioning protein
MTDQTKIAATIESVPFADLYLSDLNPRTVVAESGIEALAENIRRLGLIQNLGGLRDGDGPRVGIVAGGRRLRALALLQDDARFQTVAVQIAPDAETASLWATSENGQREDLHPVDEIRDYGAMDRRGVRVADIAVAYGVTEKHVYRRLALAGLPEPVLDALKAGQIGLSHAAAFTVGDDEALMIEVLARVIEEAKSRWGGLSDHQIKTMLRPNAVKGTDRRAAFVGVDAYEEAGGRIGGDLFADETLFDDPAILDDVFAAKLGRLAETFTGPDGWKWAETHGADYLPYGFMDERKFGRIYAAPGDMTEDESERYDELAELANGDVLDDAGAAELEALQRKADGAFTAEQKGHAGVIVYVRRDGTVEVIEGLVKQEDRAEAIAAGILAPSHHAKDGAEAAPKSPISDKLRADLERIEKGARQTALLSDPKLALHLLAFHLSGRMGYGYAFGLTVNPPTNAPETETGFALDKRLSSIADRHEAGFGSEAAKDFAAFRKRGDKRVMEALHGYVVSLLTVPDTELGAMIDKATARRTRDVWTPTAENFFGRVGGPYLETLWRDLLDLAEDHPTATTFAKLKKGEKVEKLHDLFNDAGVREAHGLTPAQQDRIADWLPEGMT